MVPHTPVSVAFRWDLQWFQLMHEGHELHEAVKDISVVTHTHKTHTVRNLHFLSKNSTLNSRENCQFFWGEKLLVKMLWFSTLQLLTTLISREKLSKKFE